MEIEVKLRLPTQDAYCRFQQAIQHIVPHSRWHTLYQRNVFLDGTLQELRPSKTAVRLRYERNGQVEERYVLTVKSRLQIEGGVSVAEESEQQLEAAVAERLLADPQSVLATCDTLSHNGIQLKALHDIVGQKTVGQWEIFGSFINERQTIPWDHGLLIELDKTTYPSMDGQVAYEIEMEASKDLVKQAKTELYVCKTALDY